jgi:hypothetical protein
MPFSSDALIVLDIAPRTSCPQLLLSLKRWADKKLISGQQVFFRLTGKETSATDSVNFLEISAKIPIEDFLDTLIQWQDKGLLNDAYMCIEVKIQVSNPALLEILDECLRFEFLSEYKVQQICKDNLSSLLPPVKVAPVSKPVEPKKSSSLESSNPIVSKPSPAVVLKKPPQPPRKPKPPSRVKQILQSLMAELSVLWLLLLGVFMVVISSGVIAASLWERFPAAGQYAVLWLYTLLFWGASFWATTKPNLRLTSMALRLVTLLLVPMNFFAIDSLGLWYNPLDWLIVALATTSLTAITMQLYKVEDKVTGYRQLPNNLSIHLGLSYLHWGWRIADFPLWATYLGVVGTTLMIVFRGSREKQLEEETQTTAQLIPFSLNGAIVTYALAILLIRAIFIAGVDITQLGLAVGISGWLISQQAKTFIPWWERIGGGLLLFGWLLSVVEVPWQALGVTVLGILFFTRRLFRAWLKLDYAIILLIGLQGLWLLWSLIPNAIAQEIIQKLTTLTDAQATPWTLLSIALLPYLIVIVILNEWLAEIKKSQLSKFGNNIALVFGCGLTMVSLGNPVLRTINFAVSTLVLATITQRKITRIRREYPSPSEDLLPQTLAHYTHLAGLTTLFLAIDWILPHLSIGIWGVIAVILMVAELLFSLIGIVSSHLLTQLLSKTAWALAIILGLISYGLFSLNQGAVLLQGNSLFDRPVIASEWSFVWGLAPLALTGFSKVNPPRKQIASWLSVVALLQWQLLTLAPLLIDWFDSGGIEGNFGIASLALVIATGLMWVNTSNLESKLAGAITVGFGLSWLAVNLWEGIFGWTLRGDTNWLLAGMITVTSLWIIRHQLQSSDSSWGDIYSPVCDGWATFFSGVVLFSLLSQINFELTPPDVQITITSCLIMGATVYRSSQPSRNSQAIIWLSIVVLLLAPIATWGGLISRIVTVAIACGLMFLQTYRLQDLKANVITVGLLIALVTGLLLQWSLSGWAWLLAGAIAVNILWGLRQWLNWISSQSSSPRRAKISILYAQACDSWAIPLCVLDLAFVVLYPVRLDNVWLGFLASVLLMLGVAYRSWQTPRTLVATWLTVATLVIAQIPWLEIMNYRLLGLVVATGVMILPVIQWRQLDFVQIHTGFTLSLTITAIGDYWLGWKVDSIYSWFLVGAIAIFVLWGLKHWLRNEHLEVIENQATEQTSPQNHLNLLYSTACDYWAMALSSLELFILLAYTGRLENHLLSFSTLVLLMGAVAYRSWQKPRNLIATGLSVFTLIVVQLPLFGLSEYRLIGLAVATGLMIPNVFYWRQLNLVIIHVGFALALVITSLLDFDLSSIDVWLLSIAIIVATLWLLRTLLNRSSKELNLLYGKAVNRWGIFLFSLELLLLTIHSLTIYVDQGLFSASILSIGASAITLGAVTYHNWSKRSNLGIYSIGWSLEILTIEVLDYFTGNSLIALAIANIVLGLLTQILGNWWYRQTEDSAMLSSWNVMPLFYGALGSSLRWGLFSDWTGLTTLGLAFIIIGVGRRSEAFKPLIYLSLVAISLSAYELLFYQVINLPKGDQFLAIAALMATFVYAYQLLGASLSNYLGLSRSELQWFERLHWVVGSCLLIGGVFYPVEVNKFVGLGAGIFLSRYAIYQGRNHPQQTIGETWVYVGLLEASAITVYTVSLIGQTFFAIFLTPWSGFFASMGAVACSLFPWRSWGWSSRPWQSLALILPLIPIMGYPEQINQISLLIIGGFYLWLARKREQSRWYYLTLIIFDWLIIRWLEEFALAEPFAYIALLGLSIICLTAIEPLCQGAEGKTFRHYLRLFGTGIICGSALWLHYETGIIPGIVSLLAIFAGLAFQTRAFLYIGTLTFLGDVFYQLVILVFDYPLLKWVVGLILGISLLFIASSFETRRTQLSALLQNWVEQLQNWE